MKLEIKAIFISLCCVFLLALGTLDLFINDGLWYRINVSIVGMIIYFLSYYYFKSKEIEK